MYSLLQSLHLIPPYSIPSALFFLPYGEFPSTLLPPLPQSFSLSSLGGFFLSLLKAPPLLIYLYVYLRPKVEVRLYRLIRRRLPKPSLADELSIRVAFENDLIDWMVPTLGRRAEEENRRGRLTFVEDLKYDISTFGSWIMSWVDFWSRRRSDGEARLRNREERIESLRLLESLRDCIEELQNELGAAQSRTRLLPRPSIEPSQVTGEQAPHDHAGGAQAGSPGATVSTQAPVESLFNMDQIFTNEENRISQSPVEMTGEHPTEMAPRTVPSTAGLPNESVNTGIQAGDEAVSNRLNSRSNTLFSPPSSPGTSPPTSPRVRASLIHQTSDIITMQLELLTNSNTQNQNQQNARAGNEERRPSHGGVPNDRRSITEFLDSLLANQGPSFTAGRSSDVGDIDGLSNLTTAAPPATGDNPSIPTLDSQPQGVNMSNPVIDSPAEAPVTSLANILPDGVEEPGHEDIHNQSPEADQDFENQTDAETRPVTSRSTARPRSMTTNLTSPAHRVTILSAHPVDSLASHLASMLTTALFIPLESLYLRSLASSYLSSRGSSAGLRYNVLPLGVWAGGGSVSDAMVYMGKLAVLMGMQVAMNTGVWGIITGTVVYIGKTFCGWGTL